MKKELAIVFFVILLSSFSSALLGISPAVKEESFQPGMKLTTQYEILSDQPDRVIDLYLAGDLAQYAKIEKESITGEGKFSVSLELPNQLEIPGYHYLTVGAKETPPENEFLGTAIDVKSIVRIYVPYPGKFAEIEMAMPNGNIDDEIPVEIHVINRGQDNISANVTLNLYQQDIKTESLIFSPYNLSTGEDKYFRRYLNTTGYLPADYYAEAVVDYGYLAKVNKTIRIGSMFVNITNFTEKVKGEGIQKFNVGLESLWNGEIKEVYAEINLSSSLNSMVFRTPSVDLKAWEKNDLEGFVDTQNLAGEYDTEIKLKYNDYETLRHGKLRIERANYTYAIIASAIGMICLILAAWAIAKRRRYRKQIKK